VDSPETQTIRSAAGCHVNFFREACHPLPESHALRRLVTEASGTRQRLYLMRDP
jgi:hypothetical protein